MRLFLSVFNFEHHLSIERNGIPFARIPPAPEKLHEYWEEDCDHKTNLDILNYRLSIGNYIGKNLYDIE